VGDRRGVPREVGRLVEGDSPTAIAEAVLDLARSPVRRRTIGRHARASVLARYSLERLVSNIESVYDRLLQR